MVKKRNEDFSLIELLIVTAIIGIIASMAIPNLLDSKRGANEGAAQTTLRRINSAEADYRSTTEAGCYGTFANHRPAILNASSAEVIK